MVFIDPTDSSILKVPKDTITQPTVPAAPPAYGAIENTRRFPATVQPYQSARYDDRAPSPGRDSPGKRFLKALAVAVLVWALLGVFIRSAYWALLYDLEQRGYEWGEYSYPSDVPVNTDLCLKPNEWERGGGHDGVETVPFPYQSSAFFQLPLTSESLYLVSRGPWSAAVIHVNTATDQPSDSVGVRVTVHYERKAVRNVVQVCPVSRRKGESGVGIFTPKNLGQRFDPMHRDRIHVHVAIAIPELVAYKWPLFIKNLETDVENCGHTLEDLSEKVKFENLTLKTRNGRIDAHGVSAKQAFLTTSNSGITGSFNVTKELSLFTSNGGVAVTTNLGNHISQPTTKLHIRTTNAGIKAVTHLYAAEGSSGVHSTSKYNHQYAVDMQTSNGALDAVFDGAPSDLTLSFAGSTKNAHASLLLPSAFQGTFAASTSNAQVILIADENAPDPAGQGRERKLQTDIQGKTTLKGNVKWVPGGNAIPLGRATLQTSNGKVQMIL